MQRKGFDRSEAVNAAFLHGCVRFQVNGMIPWLMLWESLGSLFAEDRFVYLKLGRDLL